MAQSIPALAFANAALRNRFRIATVVGVAVAVAAGYVLTRPAKFSSSAAFSLQGASAQRLSGLAAQFGLAIPTSDGQLSPAFYEELLGSREILAQVATATFADSARGGTPMSLAELLNVRATNPAVRVDNLTRRLRSNLSTSRSRETGVVRVSVAAPEPWLAQAILRKILNLVVEFNVKTRQSQAANERRFVEQRLAKAETDLSEAENRLRDFLQRNRGGFSNVPDLSLTRDRLMRDVQLRQQLYTSLAQNYEQARLDEVRDTPALTLIESPDLPVRRAPRGLVRTTAIVAMIALIVALLPLSIQTALTTHTRSAAEELAEFQRLRPRIPFWSRSKGVAPRSNDA